jgi:antitoxin (DNA-binding transcriptional repressor) of toxin-antitoxin stability system
MQTLPLHVFRAQLAQTLDRVLKGERVQVTRHGVAVIELRPVQPVKTEAQQMWKRTLKPHPLSKSARMRATTANPVLDERYEQYY